MSDSHIRHNNHVLKCQQVKNKVVLFAKLMAMVELPLMNCRTPKCIIAVSIRLALVFTLFWEFSKRVLDAD